MNHLSSATESPLALLADSIRKMRGSETSFRCGLCRVERSKSDITQRTFSHASGCPAAVLNQLEQRPLGQGARNEPSLVSVDLSKAEQHDHPEIVPEDQLYLAKINDEYFLGTFYLTKHGLNFDDGWGKTGHQFEAPGHSGSGWEALWALQI